MIRNRYYFFIALALISYRAAGQTQTPQDIKQNEQASTNLSTGTQEDVLANYLQIAAKSVTSSNSGLQVKLNWFSLNTNPSRYENANYFSTFWQRNGEFIDFAGAKSWQAGFNFNLINHRDTTMQLYTKAYVPFQLEEANIIAATITSFKPQLENTVNATLVQLVSGLFTAGNRVDDLKSQINTKLPGLLRGKPFDQAYIDLMQTALNVAIAQHAAGPNMPVELTTAINKAGSALVSEALSAFITDYATGKLDANSFSGFITAQQVTAIEKSLNDQVQSNDVLSKTLGAKTLPEVAKNIKANYEQLVSYVARQPLLTLGYLYNHQIGTGTPYHLAGFTYLMSFGSAQSTHIGQLKASLTDTLGGNGFNRNIIAFQAGYNQVLITQKKTSLAEINGALEEDKATSGYISKTSTGKFYLDAYIQARLPSTPWLKLDLKYDPKGGNVFGLLDFTYNFGQ